MSEPARGSNRLKRDALGPLIGAGRQANVFAWKAGTVIKLYRQPGLWPQVARERRNACIARDLGFDAPRVYETVEVDGCPGLVLDRIEGTPLADLIFAEPWRASELARRMADVHVRMHALQGGDLCCQHRVWEERIRESQDMSIREQRGMLALLFDLPRESALCHGDLTPDNILVNDGGFWVIDWCRTNSGSPLADVANSLIKLDPKLATLDHPGRQKRPRHSAAKVERTCHLFRQSYLEHYRHHRSFSDEFLAAWMAVSAAAQLNRATPAFVHEQYHAIIASQLDNVHRCVAPLTSLSLS